MNVEEIEKRNQKFMSEYTPQLSSLDPEIIQNPAFKRIVEYYIAPMVYANGDYTWGYATDSQGYPKTTPQLQSDVSVEVSKDGKHLKVTRNPAPLNIPGKQFSTQQVSIIEVDLDEEGILNFTESSGSLEPSNNPESKNFHASYNNYKYDRNGNKILYGHLTTSTYVNRRALEGVVNHIFYHQPKFSSSFGIVEQRQSFSGDLERGFIVSRDMVNPADNFISIMKPGVMMPGTRYIRPEKSHRIADLNTQYPDEFSPYVINAGTNIAMVDYSSPYVIDASLNSTTTKEEYEEYCKKVCEIQANAGIKMVDSQSVDNNVHR